LLFSAQIPFKYFPKNQSSETQENYQLKKNKQKQILHRKPLRKNGTPLIPKQPSGIAKNLMVYQKLAHILPTASGGFSTFTGTSLKW
jgi:hypothetical protein